MRINQNMNALLDAPFTTEEVRKAVFDLHPDKAPGPNGMSAFSIKNSGIRSVRKWR